MGEHVELTSQIAPQSPSIRNPFESPNDYQQLQEALVPSPSVFRSKPCKSTPPKFDWSIDEMASLLPVHIDQEEIQRQSFYLSQTRMDSDIEEKRQNAIEQFFTKGTIVPSPWATAGAQKDSQLKMKCYEADAIAEEPEKHSVACQTTLSLPLTFDLEKILGHYYRQDEEACEAVQESLSTSSLRRKLFLDGRSSGSDSSGPPSPERRLSRRGSRLKEAGGAEEEEEEAAPSVLSSPPACGRRAQTPSTGQFSSSPIRNGCFRDCSLGSISSPLLPHRSSPAGLATPTPSPIVAPITPSSADRKQPSSLAGRAGVAGTPCSQSPFVEGCSPIHGCSPHHQPRLRLRSTLSPPLVSPILHPKLADNQEAERLPCSSSSTSPPMDLDPSSPSDQNAPLGPGERVLLDPTEPLKMEEDEQSRVEEEGGEPLGRLTSSRVGNASPADGAPMSVSLLAEGYDSSMQVDSGYSTGAASLVDAESQCRDAGQPPPSLKVFYPQL